ncbi:MAG: hypothetical protein ACOX0M_09170 [Salinivirgaceae bacterium]|nr:hypothetical protein [Bacteroidales bacterium]
MRKKASSHMLFFHSTQDSLKTIPLLLTIDKQIGIFDNYYGKPCALIFLQFYLNY